MKVLISAVLPLLLLSMTAGFPSEAFAVSYIPRELTPEAESETDVVKTGSIAFMFHSGTEDVRNAIGISDVLPVYREDRFREMHQVGIIRVLSNAGENYYRIIVIEGGLRFGDIARKGGVSCLIILHRPGEATKE